MKLVIRILLCVVFGVFLHAQLHAGTPMREGAAATGSGAVSFATPAVR